MKIYSYLLITLFSFLLLSCEKEEMIPVKADFGITVVNNDYTVPVKVEIENKTTGADTYQWTFEGAVVETSTDKNPAPAYYNTPGTYKITLKASNKDGSKDEKTIEIQIDAAMDVNFDWQMQGSDIAPVTLQMVNQSKGATEYLWEFDGGSPATSSEENPTVTFSQGGDHKIKLTISNGKETYSTEKTLSVKPAMTVDFDWSVDFIDEDYQAPVTLHINNESTNATAYQWTFAGSSEIISTAENPDITISTAGTYTLQLKASNDKESKTVQKQVTVYPDKNLLSFTNVKLGINTAKNTIGCFFSCELGKVIKQNEVTSDNGAKIDFAFFGLDASFSYNQFLSPDKVQTTAFESIPNATYTKINNRQELTGVQLTPAQFDAIDEGKDFNSLVVSENSTALTPFDNTTPNRIVLFQTQDGRKGAIKILSYTADGLNSYILVDIKVQKKS